MEQQDFGSERQGRIVRAGRAITNYFRRMREEYHAGLEQLDSVDVQNADSLTARRYTALEDLRDEAILEREGIASYDHTDHTNPLYYVPLEAPDYPPLHDDTL